MDKALEKGTFVLSIDTELAWGAVHNGSFGSREGHYRRTREAITLLLELLERYEIQATWAVAGHLFLDRCQSVNGVKHPEIVRPAYPWFQGDWFDADPCSSLAEAPFWYGSDIVEQVLSCPVPQEVGCHGFGHMIIGDPGCSRDCFDSDLKACIGQAERWGVTLKSFIFPRNSIGHLDVLKDNGFTAFRGVSPEWYQGLSGPWRKAARLADSLAPIPPPATLPRRVEGLWDLPASYFYPHRDGWARLVPMSLNLRRAKQGLERAADQGAMFHLWFHPFNLASDVPGLIAGLETIFKGVKERVGKGSLANHTMADLAASLEQVGEEVKKK